VNRATTSLHVEACAPDLGQEGWHIPDDDHFPVGHPGRLLEFADVSDHTTIALGVGQRLGQDAVGVTYSARCQARILQGRVPPFDLKASELLEDPGADVRSDLVFDQLPVTLGRTCRYVASGLPLVDAPAHKIGHRRLAGLGVGAGAHGCNQPCAFSLGLLLGALKRMPFAFALPRRPSAGLFTALNDNYPQPWD
jgi:hypothetical protein